MLPFALLRGAALALAATGAGSQPSLPLLQGTPPAAAAQAPEEPQAFTISAADRETVELVRWALQQEGRESTRELLSEVVAALAEPEGGGESSHLAFLLELDRIAEELGSLEESRRLRESVLELLERLRPADHLDLLIAKQNLAVTRLQLGDLAGASLIEEVFAARTRLLPPDHPDLLLAKHNLATTRFTLGDVEGARVLQEEVLAACTRLLSPDSADLLRAKQNLALMRKALGDLAGARALEEEVLAARTRLLPADHPDLWMARQNLADTRWQQGDLACSRELEEILAARTRLLPPDHPDLLLAQQNLAVVRRKLGDLAGARALQEEVLATRTRLLPADHHDLLAAKQNLAGTRFDLGDFTGARELDEEVLAARARLLPADHPYLLDAQQNLAAARFQLGDVAGARELEEEVVAARTRLLSPDHPALLAAQQNLAATRLQQGDPAAALELAEQVLAARARLLPPDHPDLLQAQQNLAFTRKELGDLAGARALVASLLDGMRLRARSLRSEAVRPAREAAREELLRLFDGLFLSDTLHLEGTLDAALLATLESLRLASLASAEMAHAPSEHAQLADRAREVSRLRSRLNDHVAAGLVAAGPEEAASLDEWREELLRLAGERDRAERELRTKLAEAGAFVGEIEAQAVAALLSPQALAVSYLRYPRWLDKDPETGKAAPSVDSLLAFLVEPDGTVKRIELGPAADLEALVVAWRGSLGRPIERGIAAEVEAEHTEQEIGRALRARILDPLLAAAGTEVRELHVVLDDFLHLVPLDALPIEGEGESRVGERCSIHLEPTLARLLMEQRALPVGGTLFALGGIDFESEPAVARQVSLPQGSAENAALPAATPSALLAAAAPPTERAGRPARFEPLRQTRYEVEDVGAQYREAFDREPRMLTGDAATKAALFDAAPETRWLHLATHGWFAPESLRSQLDTLAQRGENESWSRAQQTLTGFAPETLCGLALAGANRGGDALGRVPGILTAEELATLDLRRCELAVLSACETNVGLRRAGQGIQSLQTALHAAGARTAITSLWKVDDAATRRLFELFYAKLWKEKLGKSEALWQAKMALRAEGHPLRDWAGWVLSGDPQ